MTQLTILIVGSYRLGKKKKHDLFQGLEDFANLGDHLQDLQRFKTKHRGRFFPVRIRDAQGRSLEWEPESLGIASLFRNWLQSVWRGDESADDHLSFLLGLRPDIPDFTVSVEEFEYRDLEETEPQPAPSEPHMAKIMAAIGKSGQPPSGIRVSLAPFRPSWRLGQFQYHPETDFQLAVCLLFLESWRALICGICHRYFVAVEGRQRYCSPKCAHEASLQRQQRYFSSDRGQAAQARRALLRRSQGKKGKKGKKP